jgi:hypothetical protein
MQSHFSRKSEQPSKKRSPPWMPEWSREQYFGSLKNVFLLVRLNISRAYFLRVSASSGLRMNLEFGKPVNEQGYPDFPRWAVEKVKFLFYAAFNSARV